LNRMVHATEMTNMKTAKKLKIYTTYILEDRQSEPPVLDRRPAELARYLPNLDCRATPCLNPHTIRSTTCTSESIHKRADDDSDDAFLQITSFFHRSFALHYAHISSF
jgi:hypothetical protein